MIRITKNLWINSSTIIDIEVIKDRFAIECLDDRIFIVEKEFIPDVCSTLGLPYPLVERIYSCGDPGTEEQA